ncbi:helix-turn-helix transcriptional regulator [Pseudonocardia eucalypti]|uniref:Helix-turn-helix transcriptional regulator n=1 Tax=Pseudonocardia eucalypti TaxID=648755 RepID=A0ABP9QNH9_9PSEU|nr:transcriptional regulator with XRE-family HTH domain [Pseudonocardia eucalypti]
MDDALARSIGERVQFYRTAARRSKAVVAGLAGITPDYLRLIERGQKVPTIAVLAQLADVLRVSPGELLGNRAATENTRIKTAAGDAIYQALTNPGAPIDAPPALSVLRRRIDDAWSTWQTSPHRYSRLTERLPGLIADAEHAVRASSEQHTTSRRPTLGCAADLYGLLRTVTKRIGRVDLSLLAADRALRCAEAADDPVRLAAAQWNMTQVLLSDEEPEAAEAVAMKAAERLEPSLATGSTDAAAMYGAVILMGAIAAARNGDAWTARDRLRKVVPLADRTGERNTMWTAFGPTNVAMYAVSIEFESGEASEGLRLAERVDHGQSPSIERRVAFLVDQAKGHAQRRDFASALTLLTAAEREAPEDIQYRPAAHAVLRNVAQRGRRHVAAEASQLALRIGLPV